VWYVGKGDRGRRRRRRLNWRLLGDGEDLLGVWRKGMEKEVRTLCVILMEDY
jgi:hypothetical protein